MNAVKFIIAFLLCQGAGLVGSFFTVPSIPSWYAFLEKPSFSPPNWLFGPAWLTLYTLMAISLYLVWQKGLDKTQVRQAFNLFLIHLVFNALWSFSFFGLKNPLLGLANIILIWLFIILLIFKFFKISKPASILLVPYFLWVSFASLLNYSIFKLN